MMPGRFPLSLLLLAASPAALMLPTPAAMAADADAAVPSDVVAEHYAAQLEANYVYPDIGKRYAAALRAGIAAGRYAPWPAQRSPRRWARRCRACRPTGICA